MTEEEFIQDLRYILLQTFELMRGKLPYDSQELDNYHFSNSDYHFKKTNSGFKVYIDVNSKDYYVEFLEFNTNVAGTMKVNVHKGFFEKWVYKGMNDGSNFIELLKANIIAFYKNKDIIK